jgi:hypothetical protein
MLAETSRYNQDGFQKESSLPFFVATKSECFGMLRSSPAGSGLTHGKQSPYGPHVLPETRYARSGEINIAYQVVGGGPRDIVFVPGVVSHVEFFRALSCACAIRTVKNLVVGSGFQFDDRGIRDLKGVPDSWQVYALVGKAN